MKSYYELDNVFTTFHIIDKAKEKTTYNIRIPLFRLEIIINLRTWATWARDATSPKVVILTHPLYTINRNTYLEEN